MAAATGAPMRVYLSLGGELGGGGLGGDGLGGGGFGGDGLGGGFGGGGLGGGGILDQLLVGPSTDGLPSILM